MEKEQPQQIGGFNDFGLSRIIVQSTKLVNGCMVLEAGGNKNTHVDDVGYALLRQDRWWITTITGASVEPSKVFQLCL